MFLPNNYFFGCFGKLFGLDFLPRKQHLYFCCSRGHHLTHFGWRRNIINQLLEVQNFILGIILYPIVKICEVLILSKFGSIHYISNGFLNRLLHVGGRLNFLIISDKFPFNVVHIVMHIPFYYGVVDLFIYLFVFFLVIAF